ncbi:diguanylate cyclase [Leifsonia sp. NPDC058292]|uniref:sensor domain-containing diguanylate cyclase n=1 Tax=Leifsonia sp. NPDC058292 TaxID=3346428 RepID=UPI0036D9F4DE
MTGDLDALYEGAPCGLLSMTPDGRIARMNETLLAWTGYTREQLTGEPFVSLLDPGSRLFYETRQLPMLRLNGEMQEIALGFVRADGERLAALVNSVAVSGDDGELERIDTAIFDATRRQDFERQLLIARREAEASEARTRVLQRASAAFVDCDTEDDLAQALADSAREAFTASATAVHLGSGGGFRLAGGSEPFDLQGTLASRPPAETIDVVSTDPSADLGREDAALAAALDGAKMEELTITPLLEGGAVIGVFACFFGRARGLDDATAELHYALARQAVQVLRRIRFQTELEAYALYDPLTGLANRALLRTRLAEAIESAETTRTPLSLVFIDLDGFKSINDDFDHSAGDAVLRETASRLAACVRRDDVVGRFGGDEFLVVCEDADEEAACHIAERIRVAVREPLAGIADERSVSASIGVAVYRANGVRTLSMTDVFRIADAAMYASKDAGKDRVSVTTV